MAAGSTAADVVSSLAGRLARLNHRLGKAERARLVELGGGRSLTEIVSGLVDALDPDRHIEIARREHGVPKGAEPTVDQVTKVAEKLIQAAVSPLATNPTNQSVV